MRVSGTQSQPLAFVLSPKIFLKFTVDGVFSACSRHLLFNGAGLCHKRSLTFADAIMIREKVIRSPSTLALSAHVHCALVTVDRKRKRGAEFGNIEKFNSRRI